MRRFLLCSLLAGALASAGCPGVPPEETPENVSPRARFVSPAWVQAGAAASFDASESFDPDGTIIAYRFLFGDGSAEVVSASPRVEHVYGAAGTYTVWLSVEDAQGAEGRAAHGLGVTLDAPVACVAEGDCGAGETCAADGLCYRTGPGDACAADEECVGTGFTCHGGVCTEADCESDAECAPAEVCRVGRCQPTGLDGGEADGGSSDAG
ncbi:MAG: PKD domain-containing protein [Deltaproteobacteria bacterium]|nr:PKD domain-containing protein [Deltaproteobacteria bacterium]